MEKLPFAIARLPFEILQPFGEARNLQCPAVAAAGHATNAEYRILDEQPVPAGHGVHIQCTQMAHRFGGARVTQQIFQIPERRRHMPPRPSPIPAGDGIPDLETAKEQLFLPLPLQYRPPRLAGSAQGNAQQDDCHEGGQIGDAPVITAHMPPAPDSVAQS